MNIWKNSRIIDLKNLSLKICQSFRQPSGIDANKDYYAILGVNIKANAKELKEKYYKLAKKFHPDVNKGAEEKFKEITQAYDVLSHEDKRKEYDALRLAKT